ncbi:MAG: VWA domain-containing protein [Pirellulaceae bacterium]
MGTLRFAGDAPPWMVFTVAAIAAAFVAWIYLRETKTLEAPYSYLLPSLRATAVALTILLLAGPVIHRRQVVGKLGRVVFAIDTSKSMSVTDSGQMDSSPERIRRAVNVLVGDESNPGWLSTLKESHELDVVSFASGEPTLLWSSRNEEAVPTTFQMDALGERTDLSSSLSMALDSFDPNETIEAAETDQKESTGKAALVVFSDGRDNVGQSATDLAKQLRAQSYAIHTVGVGSPSEPTDVGIVNVVTPESVASDGQLAGELVLKKYGLDGQPVQVRIESAGKTVWQKTVDTGSNGLQNIPFQLDVDAIVEALNVDSERGVQRSTIVMDLTAAVEPIEGDSASDNNSRSFRVAATTRDRRLLIVDGSSRWETRYLRNLFERDPAWNVNTVLVGKGTDHASLLRGDGDGEFPADREELAKYDAIVLGEIDGAEFSSTDILLIKEFVSRGGGLIAIDGRYGQLRQLADGVLSELIPIRYDRATPRLAINSLELTTMGKEHPLMNLYGESQQIDAFWQQIPGPKSVNHVQAQEGAEVWANAVGEGGLRSAWLVTRLFGGGRVFYLSSDETWRWRYKVADRFHARFWNQLLAAVMQPPYSASDEYVALGTDKIEYKTGESATIRVRLQDTRSMPVGDATVDALLIANDRVVATIPLNVDDPARGTYQGQTPPMEPGAFSVRVRASGFDESALQASTPFWVGKTESIEMRRVGLDETSLTQIATAAGGAYVHESSVDSLLEKIKPLSSGSIVESDYLIWQSYFWFWAVIALLAIEWWLRKRSGLV